jgi:hypothetical protein
MEKEELINELSILIRKIFIAENSLADKYEERLAKVKELGEEEKQKLADEYVHAIAEIVADDLK